MNSSTMQTRMANDSEYCLGTVHWCTAHWPALYNSEKSCREHRSIASFVPESVTHLRWELPSQAPPEWNTCPTKLEACTGTEEFCSQLKDQDRISSCLDARELAPFLDRDSPRCHAAGVSRAWEVCRGTKAWCHDPDTVMKFYNGSEHLCLKRRDKILGVRRYPWEDGGVNGCEEGEKHENCLGTERTCSLATDEVGCLAEREDPLFRLPDPDDCSNARSQLEPCLGTNAWCLGHVIQDSNVTEDECFSRRGFKREAMTEEYTTEFKLTVKKLVLEYGEGLAINTAYWVLLVEEGDGATALSRVVGELEGYIKGLLANLTAFVVPDVMNRVENLSFGED
ncbi:hypothetical protein GQ602_005372 [Ophiocordyceps camponoti-floridani]|uniref:Uncharacterized protein n=1 Tax=Ophiocordyceps camponoti-floridani TaxID=2030778 RepID=A0A8H4VD49_9HYPO|nr:hypothetical protein GQ602_005372 [Ophiocordyceps camponoti-floridani]